MRRFRPSLLLSFATVALTAILLSLGFWQLERAELRRTQDELKQERAQLSPVYITSFPGESLEELADRRVRLRGRYLPWQFLLDNQIHGKQPGYHVLSPFELSTYEQVVLINRGWVPAGADRSRLPPVPIPTESEVQLEGVIYLPQPNPFTDSDHLLEGHGWPQVIQGIDYPRLAERLGELSLVPATVRLAENQPHGYTLAWPSPPMSAEKHTAYAVQWFAMAAAVVILFFLYSVRPIFRS
ncbi:MAG: SURF1 family protein [Gammaproteobacteria bacterium]|nr:SURF1 family protein [Gammaproteobacteria bacterium]